MGLLSSENTTEAQINHVKMQFQKVMGVELPEPEQSFARIEIINMSPWLYDCL